MVRLEGAASGEEVSRDTVREFKAKSSERLSAMRRQGLSDQRIALINQILADRRRGATTPASELVKKFEEPRRIVQPQIKVSEVKPVSPKPIKPLPSKIKAPIDIKVKLKFSQRIRDITSFGLTREARERTRLSNQIQSFNREAQKFEQRFGGRRLSEGEFLLAKKEEARLERKLKQLEQQEKEIKKAIPTRISEILKKSSTSLRKEKIKIVEEKGIKALLDPRFKKIDQELQARGVAQTVVSAATGILLLPETIKNIITDPSSLKKIPAAIKEGGKEFSKIALISPNEALARIGTEVFLLKGTGKAFSVVGKLTSKNAARITGKLAKVKGSTIAIKTRKTITKIEIVKPGLKKIKIPLAKQIEIIGKKIPIVTSAQANKIVSIIKTKRTIKKPIPKEKLLKPSTRKLLAKFDRGQISKKDIIKLDIKIRRDTKGRGNLLERSFFVDPKGRVRISRLRIQRDATISDILRGDFTLKTSKPQIIFFKDILVEEFPKSQIFVNIKKKLKSNKALTTKESRALLKFQIRKSGKFKPIGALSKEPELTLAPGEIVKKVKTVAKVEINGKIVPIVQAKVVKATKQTAKLLKKSKTGRLTRREAKTLKKRLKRETKFKASEFSRTSVKPRIPIKRKALVGVTRIRKIRRRRAKPLKRVVPRPKRRIMKGVPRARPRPVPRPKPRAKPRAAPRPSPKPPTRAKPRPSPRPPARPRPRPARLIRVKKRKIVRRKKKVRRQAYDVFVRPLKKTKKQKRPKLVKVGKVPLTRRRAKDVRAYVIDTSLARSGRIRKTKGKPRQTRLRIPKGYAKRTKFKFRDFRRIKGKKVPLKRKTIIERRARLLDTPQEKRQITLRRRIAQISKPSKRKATPSQLAALKKGRAKLQKIRSKK